MKPSAFASMGLLALSSKEPLAKRIYNAAKASLGPSLATDSSSFTDTFAYAFAMAAARSATLLERAFGQMLPEKVYDLLAAREDEYGLVPNPGASIPARRGALAARMLLPGGAGALNVENALRALLGPRFVAYRTTQPSERATWPAKLGDAPQNLVSPLVPRKLVRIVDPVSIGLGAPQTVTYTSIVPPPPSAGPQGTPGTLVLGDALVVEPEISGRAEVVVVTEVSASAVLKPGQDAHSSLSAFTAVFQQAHEPNCWATTIPYPLWMSTQRAAFIVLTLAAALDTESRREVHDLMGRLARAVSTWAVVQQTGPDCAGPFVLDQSPLDTTPLGRVTFP